ncbi:nucleoside permease [Shimwellia blattae]|uniref:Nucleoside transport protein n=1 Tax=Shimwellia blattae (strain ATCC 29907 / DSM 4481 / JCM 1650 / NBRC 105725 / CDC 9005-74) TaxID=630626 RepID=I2B8K5_SHIBC|nr:nucleoside permease [Shimwellia blattae]AFJ46859.1 nucleoside transport protein [Shimwellia blattae DSM 4481 = NBRC 105725]GAB82481.1 xanthosine permease [Shimwellia blattae DSM 4481 = NBRC 105725]VDY64342.1 Xanthosine transporter [Shimwellia blattae]VEC22461.1 Xanthosine transporter [Shimwellia blattae]
MKIQSTLKIMLFSQYFIWGCWLVTFASYAMRTLSFTGSEVGVIFSSLGLAAVVMPPVVGIIADKWISANKIYIFCHIVSAASLYGMSAIANSGPMFWMILLNAVAYMPTIALSNTISYFSLEKSGQGVIDFPRIRIWGTIGFIIAMWLISFLGFEVSRNQLYIASGASVFLALFSLSLPRVVPSAKSMKTTWLQKTGLDAFVLLRQKNIAVFLIFATLLGSILQITNTFGNPFLHHLAALPGAENSVIARYPSVLLSVSQISEVVFILTIPFLMNRLGLKRIILLSMVAWVARFGLFAWGDFTSVSGVSMLLLSMIVYGCAFDFFNVSGSMYLARVAGEEMRASAQGLFMTMVNGFGLYIGSIISGHVIDYFTVDGVQNWSSFWLVFSGYALVLAVVFWFVYREESSESGPMSSA